jgi:hypothetical protein
MWFNKTMTHNKEFTNSTLKSLALGVLLLPLLGIDLLVLLAFPLTWLIFQGIYNLEAQQAEQSTPNLTV